jgi:hypothetical protein
MMLPSGILNRVLNELEGGNADGVERTVVGLANPVDGYGRGPQRVEKFESLREDRSQRLIVLQVDSTYPTRPIEEIEIATYLSVH